MLQCFRKSMFWALCVLGLSSSMAQAKEAPVFTSYFSNVAVSGYDPVAYFTLQKPVKGDAKFTTMHNGAEWRFVSTENRDKFVANPTRYAPQYGGYCAWAVSQGYTASADPLRWKIVNDKLYLNYDADVQKKWEMSVPEFIQAADKNWPKVIQ
jgi:YHS domain-containing protein